MNTLKITHMAVRHLHNTDAAKAGEASIAVNLRERENCLEVVGTPKTVGQIPAGHHLLAIHNGRYITSHENRIYCDGEMLGEGEASAAFAVGQFLVVATSAGYLYFRHTDNGYTALRIADAIPRIALTAEFGANATADLPAYEFSERLTSWQSPLPSVVTAQLSKNVASAWRSMQRNIADNGYYCHPVMVRYGVRLWDDNYLWVSAPVLLGAEVVSANYRAATTATLSGDYFTGINAATLSLPCFSIKSTVITPIAPEWSDLVKSIDILVSEATPEIALASTLDYRMGISYVGSSRTYVLEYGPAPRKKAGIFNDLMQSEFRIKDSATRISSERLATLTQQIASAIQPITALGYNGRLFTGGLRRVLQQPWWALNLCGTTTTGTCQAKLMITHATVNGTATVCHTETLPFTPSALAPFIAVAGTSATHLRVEITASGATKVWESDLITSHDHNFAYAFNPNFASLSLSSGTASGAATQGNTLTLAGEILVSAAENPFVVAQQTAVCGNEIRALAIAQRPVYSAGFGRYPLYVFTTRGTYALPQTTTGTFREACLMSHQTLSSHCQPIAGGNRIWFLTTLNQLCSIKSGTITKHLEACDATQLAWNNAEDELIMSNAGHQTSILMPSNRTAQLTTSAQQLFYDGLNALAIDAQGNVADWQEEDATSLQSIHYLSHPISSVKLYWYKLRHIVWNIFAQNIDVRLQLRGVRGNACHGYLVSGLRANGNLNAPLSTAFISPPARTYRIEISGTATAGTQLQPTILGE